MSMEIQYNTVGTNDPCAICGTRTDPIIGPEMFIGFGLVCRDCSQREDPKMHQALVDIHEAMIVREEMDHGCPAVSADFVLPPGSIYSYSEVTDDGREIPF